MMLSQQTIATIKSTVPVMEVYGTQITSTFYERMFAAHPELLNIFNHANQKQGRQQAALANAVYAAAKHIDQLEAILPVVRQIAHKHRSLGILPEHYPIVGEHLLAAIAEVLGEQATEEILQAWAEAYGVIADVFISVESELYEEAEAQQGGWSGFRTFRVERKVRESEVITSFYLVPADGGALPSFQPGQYISVKMNIPDDTYTHIRQYSLSDAPGRPYYRISVKREDAYDERPAGKISTYLHEQVAEGDVLELSAPAGEFVLDEQDSRPVVLISGGVGLTPMMSMLNTLSERSPARAVTFIHAAKNSQYHAMREAVEELTLTHHNYQAHWVYAAPSEVDRSASRYYKEGYIDLDWLRSVISDQEAAFYFCGPVPFMKTVYQALRACGVPEQDIHFEFFGPAADLQ